MYSFTPHGRTPYERGYDAQGRGSGHSPFWPRAAGIGPFRRGGATTTTGAQWVQQNLRTKGVRSRRSRRGGGIKDLAKRAWAALKSKFIPLAKRHGKTFMKNMWDHAVTHGPEYAKTFRAEGVKGVASQFKDQLPGLAGQFVRDVSTRGAGPACEMLGTIMASARPELDHMLTLAPTHMRPTTDLAAMNCFIQGHRGAGGATDDVAPLQLAQDMVMHNCIQNLNSEERGGFLPLLLPLLGPILASAAGALVGSVPKIVELAQNRGRGGKGSSPLGLYVVPSLGQPRGGGARGGSSSRAVDAVYDGQPFQMSSVRKAGFIKWDVSQTSGGRGRPTKKVVYVSNNMSIV